MQFLWVKKHLVLIRKNSFNQKNIRIKNISLQLTITTTTTTIIIIIIIIMIIIIMTPMTAKTATMITIMTMRMRTFFSKIPGRWLQKSILTLTFDLPLLTYYLSKYFAC